MANQAFTGVVLLNKPTIDKIAALALIRTFQPELPTDPEVISFWSERDCPAEQIEKWRRDGVFPVDLGREKYQQGSVGKRFGSATEFVADFFGLTGDATVRQIVGEINENNRTGHLKGFTLSAAYLIRKLYELPEYDMKDVVNHACHVVQMRIVAHINAPGEGRTLESLAKELPDLWEATERCNFAPYTAGEYMRNLWRQGHSVEDIRDWIYFWLNAAKDVEEAKRNAERVLPNTPGEEFTVPGIAKGRYVETDNTFITTAAAERYGVVIAMNSRGQMVVQTKHYDVSALAQELFRLQGSRHWFHDSRQGCVINGGVIYSDVPGSKLGRRMIHLVQKFPPRANQQRGR